jgi:hypothetical protein
MGHPKVAKITIGQDHAKMEEGHMFGITQFESALANNGFIDILCTIPADHEPHFKFLVHSGGDALFQIYEDTASVAPSPLNPITPLNLNRASSRTTNLTFSRDPALSSPLGTPLGEGIFVPGGSGGGSTGSALSLFGEKVLKPSSVYLFRWQNISGVVNGMTAHALYHTD